jgi:ring-1,2-phenylacetyl-CoA epoxidase subunit PaaD
VDVVSPTLHRASVIDAPIGRTHVHAASAVDLVSAVARVCDPELGDVTLGDLGVVRSVRSTPWDPPHVDTGPHDPRTHDLRTHDLRTHDHGSLDGGGLHVEVVLIPTFTGCPALSVIESQVRAAVADVLQPVPCTVHVAWDRAALWTSSAVSPPGRARLAALGIAVGPDAVCVRCNGELAVLSATASTSCRSVSRCTSCGEIVEVLRGASERRVPVLLTPARTLCPPTKSS